MTFEAAIHELRAARKERGSTVAEVARRSGIGVSALQNYESGLRVPDLATLERWAAALDLFVVFDLRAPTADARAERAAEAVRQMDGWRARAAGRLVDLTARARPDQIQAALAAFEALIEASVQEAGVPPQEQPPARS